MSKLGKREGVAGAGGWGQAAALCRVLGWTSLARPDLRVGLKEVRWFIKPMSEEVSLAEGTGRAKAPW